MHMKKLLFAALVVMVIVTVGVDTLAGKGGGGKPPKDEPPPDPAIVYVDGLGGASGAELTVMNEDGSNLTVLMTGGEGTVDFRNPCWSPDGTQLAFWHDDGVNGKGIYTLDVVVTDDSVSGTNLEWIAPASYVGPNPNPAWSPVPVFGEYRIAFGAPDELGGLYRTVHLINGDGSGDVTNLAVRTGDISWSPSGDRIAVAHGSQSVKIYDLDQDTDGTIYVATISRYDVAPVDDKISFVDWAKTLDDSLAVSVWDPDTTNSDIWIIDLQDGVLDPDANPPHVDVYVLDQHINLTPTSQGDEQYPCWSPDDQRIAYHLMVSPGNTEGWYTIPVDGSEDPERLTSKKADAFWVDWRRDP